MRSKFLQEFLTRVRRHERLPEDEAFAESYAILRVIFEESTLLMGLMKPDGTLLKVNPTAQRFLSKEVDVIGKPFWDTPWWSHSAEQQHQLKRAVEAAAQGQFVRFEATHLTQRGTLSYVDVSIKPVKDERGNVVLLVPEGRIVTERKRAEEALREAAIKYRIVADNTYNWEFWLAPDGRFLYNSPSCLRISGLHATEFDANPGLIWELVHPEDRPLMADHHHDVAQARETGELEFRLVRPDGEIRWIHHICQPVFDDNGTYLGTRGSFSDITHRKLAEEKNLRLARIVESSHDGIIGKSPEGVILSWNRGAEEIFGYREDEVLGKPVYMLIPPEEIETVLRMHARVKEGEHIDHFETVSRRKDGALLDLSLTYFPITDRQGKVVAVSTIARDITYLKRAEAALRETAVKYRIVADNTYNWEFWLSPEGKFIYTSPSCERISGHPAEAFQADQNLLGELIHPDDRQLWANHRHDIVQSRKLGLLELRLLRPDGELRWVQHVCQPVFDDNGAHLGTRGSFSDITNRKLAEEKNLRLAAIVESSDDAIVGKTMEGIITSWNRGAERIFLYTEQEVLGKPITMLIPPSHIPELLLIHEKLRQGEHIEHFETVRRRKDGELIHLSLTYSPIHDAQGEIVAVSAIGRDITLQKRTAAALLDNARIKRELEIAKEIQQSLLPTCPSDLKGITMSCRCIPAAQVGGDYYDFFSFGDGKVDAVIADVTGHSVGSSLLMIMTRSVLRAKVTLGRSPGELLGVVNDLLHDDLSRAELQISMCYLRLDRKNRLVSFANAGQVPPLLFRSQEREFLELDADGLIMGVTTGVAFEEKTLPVRRDDILLLYTDGITEAENAKGDAFGIERLREVIRMQHDEHPDRIMAAIFEELDHFTGTRPISDDVAMVIFKMS